MQEHLYDKIISNDFPFLRFLGNDVQTMIDFYSVKLCDISGSRNNWE